MDCVAIYRAGLVKRWHQNPELSPVGQDNAAHQWGVAMLVLMLNPDPSPALIRGALTHDVGELRCGDLSGPFKQQYKDFANEHAEIETRLRTEMLGELEPDLTLIDQMWLNFCDRFEAILHAKFHRPDLMAIRGWPEAIEQAHDNARDLNCHDKVMTLLEGV